jgi:hypothetical protein
MFLAGSCGTLHVVSAPDPGEWRRMRRGRTENVREGPADRLCEKTHPPPG